VAAEGEAALLGEAVLFARVAGATGGDDVVPRVLPAPGPGHDVVDVLGAVVAVLAAVAVAGEDGPARERHPVAERHPYEVHEADHGGDGEDGPLGVELTTVAGDDLGLVLEHEDDGPAHRHDAERLEAGVEQQRSPQAFETSFSRRIAVPAAVYRGVPRRKRVI
jgi:hypothetical protein